MVFYLIGLGLASPSDITLAGQQALKSCTSIYLESYTSILPSTTLTSLASFHDLPESTEIIPAHRETVEIESDSLITKAQRGENVALLVVGDPLGATTHTDILIRARKSGVETRIIHNASIMNACSSSGMQLYNFGQTVSLVFFTTHWRPTSFYDRLVENDSIGLHTLLLLDIKVREQSEENMARGRLIYEPPRFMDIPTAIQQLIWTEEERKGGILIPDQTLAVALSQVGAGENERIVAGTLQELSSADPTVFGNPLHSLVLVGKRLHPLEVEYAQSFAIDKDNWRRVAEQVYKVVLDEN